VNKLHIPEDRKLQGESSNDSVTDRPVVFLFVRMLYVKLLKCIFQGKLSPVVPNKLPNNFRLKFLLWDWPTICREYLIFIRFTLIAWITKISTNAKNVLS
jgi:hypothetical protein